MNKVKRFAIEDLNLCANFKTVSSVPMLQTCHQRKNTKCNQIY